MRTDATNPTTVLSRWTRFLGAMLTVVFMVHAAAVSQPRERVVLGSAANFTVLAKSGVSVTGVTHITGDVGVSPSAATAITGFGLTMDASGIFATSPLVTGKIYSADYTAPTPAMMTTAVGDMQTAYTDAAGRTLPDHTELGAGDITGLTLAPGLYKWGTGVLVSAAGVTLSGSATDVWIFQIAQNLTVANDAIVTLSGGALASNVFWQVAGQATIGTTAQMKGNILCQTLIEVQTGATLNGRALAQTAVTFDANTVKKPVVPGTQEFDDPPSLKVKNTSAGITLDGKLDEADWNGAPTLIFGNGAFINKQGGDFTVTGGVDVKASFDVNSVTYHLPNLDSSATRVKFLRKGTDLFIGFQSNDKSICKFDWEGDGLFLIIKNSAGVDKQYKLYYQNIGTASDTIRYEEDILNSGGGAGYLFSGSKVNDTTQVDSGYSAELRVKLGSLGFDANTTSLQVAMSIFDPDGFQHPMNQWDSARGTYYKSWWGSEWGGTYRTLNLEPEKLKFDDPKDLLVKNATGTITVDGKLDEADWNGAPTLVFGNGAYLKKQGGEFTVTGEADVKSAFDVSGIKYFLPNKDSSAARVKFIRKGTDLYIGFQSNDKSICKFDWEGDGLFLIIKNSAGVDKQYKLYYQNPNDTIRYEEDILNSGAGAGNLFSGSKVNDTTQVDSGYSAELRVKLGSLGFDANTTSLQVAMSIFDPDGYQHPMNPWDSARGTYYKSWWGSEWGGTYRTLRIVSPYDNPDTMATVVAASITLDGKLNEPEWATANALVFGPSNLPKTGTDKSVTGGADVKASFDVNGITYHLPYIDTSIAKVKFLQKGLNLYIGITSNDKSICKFDWEGDGMFLMIKNSAGVVKQYKLYYQNLNDTIRYEEDILNSGAGAGFLNAGSKVNDTTQVDNGYSAELMVKLASLGFDNTVKSLQVALNVFDPDGFQHPMNPYDSARGTYFKSWWGSEWGDVFKTIKLQTITGVGTVGQLPIVFSMSQNYPNPFNPTTSIKFSVPQASVVTITVYDILGRQVTTLVNGNYVAGFYTVPFNASSLASGVYVYRMNSRSLAGDQKLFSDTKKLMLLK